MKKLAGRLPAIPTPIDQAGEFHLRANEQLEAAANNLKQRFAQTQPLQS